MATRVQLKNPRTGELKEIKVGWSWTLFLFSGFFGLPLFLRRLYIWGAVFLVLWLVNLLGPELVKTQEGALGIQIIMFVVFVGLQIWLGVKGNEMTAKNLLDQGWGFSDPYSDTARFARGKWGLVMDDKL